VKIIYHATTGPTAMNADDAKAAVNDHPEEWQDEPWPNDREEAIDRVAQELYGPAYIPSAQLRELKLDETDSAAIRRGGPDLPAGIKIKDVQRLAKLRLRFRAWTEQQDTVIAWLQYHHGLDLSARGFDPKKFEAFWTEHFGREPSAAEAGQTAAFELFRTGDRPGTNMKWDAFLDKLEQATRHRYSKRQAARYLRDWHQQLVGHF
jgi:hypothetical protein